MKRTIGIIALLAVGALVGGLIIYLVMPKAQNDSIQEDAQTGVIVHDLQWFEEEAVNETFRFPQGDGALYIQSFFQPGTIIVANSHMLYDESTKWSGDNCVVAYHEVGQEGSYIHLWGQTGAVYIIPPEVEISVAEAVHAMFRMQTSAHGCAVEDVLYHNIQSVQNPVAETLDPAFSWTDSQVVSTEPERRESGESTIEFSAGESVVGYHVWLGEEVYTECFIAVAPIAGTCEYCAVNPRIDELQGKDECPYNE